VVGESRQTASMGRRGQHGGAPTPGGDSPLAERRGRSLDG
jgi:hypothetical protein